MACASSAGSGTCCGAPISKRELREEIEAHRAMAQAGSERPAAGGRRGAREPARARQHARWRARTRGPSGSGHGSTASGRISPTLCARCARILASRLAVILVAALGIGATTSVFGLVDALMLQAAAGSGPGRLVYLTAPASRTRSFPRSASGAARSSRHSSRGASRRSLDWGRGLEPSEILTASATSTRRSASSAADRTDVHLQDDAPGGGPGGIVAVISYDCWQRRFAGDSGVDRQNGQHRSPSRSRLSESTRKGFFGVAPGSRPRSRFR